MTSPATATAAQPASAQQQLTQDQRLAEAVAVALTEYGVVTMAFAALRTPFARAGIKTVALLAVLHMVMNRPPETMQGTGDASRYAVRANLVRRAQFFVAAAHRVQQAVRDRPPGSSPVDAAAAQIAKEQRYFDQHQQASWKRTQAGAIIDGAADRFGPVLGWASVHDSRVTKDCAAANGRNFRADRPPFIGYPGMVHAECRCFPVAPWPGARLLPAIGVAA